LTNRDEVAGNNLIKGKIKRKVITLRGSNWIAFIICPTSRLRTMAIEMACKKSPEEWNSNGRKRPDKPPEG